MAYIKGEGQHQGTVFPVTLTILFQQIMYAA